MSKLIAIVMVALLAGCATNKADPNYLIQVEAYSQVQRAQADAERAKADAERARYEAIAEIGKSGDTQAKVLSVFALAIGPNGTGRQATPSSLSPPSPPESDDQKAFKWASLIAGPLTNVASGWFGYRLGVAQSNNATAATIANTNAFASTASAGFGANATIAGAGFASAESIAKLIQAPQVPQANVTLSGAGVIGGGSYSVTTTRTCTGGPGTAGNGTGTTGAATGGSGSGGAAGC